MLPRDAARRVLDATRALRGQRRASSSIGPTSGRSCSSAWTGRIPHRRGYYEKNKAFIARTPSPLRDALTEDPIQVMFNGSVEPMRALVASLRALPIADRFSVAITEYVPRDFSLIDVNARRLLEGHDARAVGGAPRADGRPTSWRSATT